MIENPAPANSTTGSTDWFCLWSQPKHEHIAAAHLRKMGGVEVFLPRIRFRRATRQGTAWVTEALFPSYLFARFNWQISLRQVQHARGIRGVVHFGERWPTIPENIIEGLRQAVGTAELRIIPAQLAAGDEVEIAGGTFHGLHAVVARVMPSRERVAVLMDFLGRQTSIELPANTVIKQGSERSTIL
ncbi:MAG: transcription termination/antitermination NusG family protein [Limisphaerales bacterium]